MELLRDVDWFVWEPVDSAYKLGDKGASPLSKEDRDTIVLPREEYPTGVIRAPLGRYISAERGIPIDLPATLEDVLKAIFAFYAEPATMSDVYDAGGEDYALDVEEMLQKGFSPLRCEVNGVRQYSFIHEMRGSKATLEGKYRRHPLMDCQGKLRFEGLHRVSDRFWSVIMGT